MVNYLVRPRSSISKMSVEFGPMLPGPLAPYAKLAGMVTIHLAPMDMRVRASVKPGMT